VNQIYFSMRSMDEVPDAAKDIVRIVQSHHRPNSVYKAQTLKQLLTVASQIADALTPCCSWWPRSRWLWAAWAS